MHRKILTGKSCLTKECQRDREQEEGVEGK